MEHRNEINISRIPVSGLGGLGLVVAAFGVAVALPALRWLSIASLVGGVAIGLFLIGARNRRARRGAEIGGLILVLAVAIAIWTYLQ